MKNEIEQINEYLTGTESVVLEAAHIYADKEPGPEQQTGAQIAAQVSAALNARVRKALLIDDFNISRNTLDTPNYLTMLKQWGFVPDDLFMESDLVSEVPGLVARIKERKTVKLKNWDGGGVRFWSPHGMVGLIKPDGRPTCPALDALLNEKKSKLAQAAITILPVEYMEQQQATRSVMEKAGISIPLVNIYFDNKGGRSITFNK